MTVSLDTTSSPTLHDPASLLDSFTELADPRREQGRIHRLDEIIFISICAVTCGADITMANKIVTNHTPEAY
jgi:hypothetical protein